MWLGTEALAVFARSDEGFDHHSVDEVAVELVEFRQPEVVTGVVRVLRVNSAYSYRQFPFQTARYALLELTVLGSVPLLERTVIQQNGNGYSIGHNHVLPAVAVYIAG